MKTRTEERAYENGLELVEITQGMNGYPSNLYKAVSGFESFEEAEDFANDVNGEVVLLSRRDGHQLWVNKGRQYKPLKSEDYRNEDETKVFGSIASYDEWALEELAYQLNEVNGVTLFQIQDMVNTMRKTYDAILDMGEDKIAIVSWENYTCDIVSEFVTRIHDDDVTTYMLAVVDHETDEDEIEEEAED